MHVVPFELREHLVPFFFLESEGKEVTYLNKKVKSCVFTNFSSIGKIIRMLLQKANVPYSGDKFNLYLEINDVEGKKKFSGKFYKHESGRNAFLKLPAEANEHVNDLLEDVFRMAFVSFVQGSVNFGKMEVVAAIDVFIQKYDLLEFGFSNMSLRQVYYREKKKDKLIYRFQVKPPSILHFRA